MAEQLQRYDASTEAWIPCSTVEQVIVSGEGCSNLVPLMVLEVNNYEEAVLTKIT